MTDRASDFTSQELSHAAFVSYSHDVDSQLANALEPALERFPLLWYQARPRRIFLDRNDLPPSSSLPGIIEQSLRDSRKLILLASTAAATSWWVAREARWWTDNRSLDDVIIVLTEGDIVWDHGLDGLDRHATTALPGPIADRLRAEPLFVDLRELRASPVDADDVAWRSALADIVAAVDGVPKDSLIGVHIRNRQRWRRVVTSFVLVLALVAASAGLAAWQAVLQRDRAVEQATIATARQLASASAALVDGRIDQARLLGVEAFRMQPNSTSIAALLQSVEASPNLTRFVPMPAPISALWTSLDSGSIVAGDRNGAVRLMNSDGDLEYSTVMPEAITAAAADVAGKVMVATTDNEVAVWDISGYGPARKIEIPDPVMGVAVDTARDSIVVLSSRTDTNGTRVVGRVRSFGLTTLSERASTDIELGLADTIPIENPRTHISIGRDHIVHVASGACDRIDLNITTLATRSQDHKLCKPANRFVEAASATATRGAFMSVGGYAEVWQGDDNAPTRFAAFPVGQPELLALSPDGERLAVAADGGIYVGPTAPQPLDRSTPSHLTGTSGVSAIEFLASDQLVTAGTGGLALWNIHDIGLLATKTGVQTPDVTGFINSPDLQLSPDSTHAAIAGEDGVVHIVDITGGTPAMTLQPGALPIPITTTWSPDATGLAVVGGNGAGETWTLGAGPPKLINTWGAATEGGHPDQVASAVWTPNDQLVIVGLDGTTWRSTTIGERPQTIVDPSERGGSELLPALSRDGQRLVRASNSRVELISLNTRDRRDLGEASTASFARFDDRDGLVVGRTDGTGEDYDATTGVVRMMAEGTTDAQYGIAASGTAVSVTTDGHIIVTDAPSRLLLASIDLPSTPQPGIGTTTGTATTLALTNNGKTFVSATSGGEVIVWSLDYTAAISAACRSAGTDLSTDDWRRFVGTDPPPNLHCLR